MKWTAPILLAVILITASCNKDDRTELFEITQLVDFQVSAGLNSVETHFFVIPSINSTFDELLANVAIEAEDVDEVTPKFCDLQTVFNDVDLDFIRAVEIIIFDPFEEETRREVFYLDPVPNNTNTIIRPFPGLADVKDILEKPVYGVEIRLRFWTPPTQSLDMRLGLEFGAYER